MDQDSELKSFVMKVAATQELSFTEDDIIPIEFCAMTDMATGEYFDIQYVIFGRPSKRSIWKCVKIKENDYYFSILGITGDGSLADTISKCM